jgi:hypothetical protein
MLVVRHFEKRENVRLTPARVRLSKSLERADRVQHVACLPGLDGHENVRSSHVITSVARR